MGVHHHGVAGIGLVGQHRLTQDALGVELQVAIDRGVEVATVDGLVQGVVAERNLGAGSHRIAGLAVGAAEVFVERRLKAGLGLSRAGIVRGAEEADQVGGDVVTRVGTHRVTSGEEAGELALLGFLEHRVGLGGGDLAGDVLEAAVVIAALNPQRREGLEVVDVQLLRQERRHLRRLLMGVEGVGRDHQAVDAVSQGLTVAVNDVAAVGGQHDVLGALVGRHLGVGVGVHALQLDQSAGKQREHHRDQDEPHPQPKLGRAPELATRRSRLTH